LVPFVEHSPDASEVGAGKHDVTLAQRACIENGTLRQGDIVLAGSYFGRVRAMFNERNQRIEEARPAEPVVILGLNGAPRQVTRLT